MGDIKKVFPFNNGLVSLQATGQTILDYLEFTSSKTQHEYSKDGVACGENGAFAQVSGLKYTIDTSIPTPVVTTPDGIYVKIEGPRRVKDVMVLDGNNYVAIDPTKIYKVASTDFLLLKGGDGATMFMKCPVINNNVMSDSDALVSYIVNTLHGKLKDTYSVVGERIKVI